MQDHVGFDWRSLYPFASHELMLSGRRCHYLDEGRGETLLLVHGNPTWSFYWRELVNGLRADHRLVVPDHIGCGLSEKPLAREYPFTFARRIDDLCELIDKLDLRRITLVAHDWGGGIGMGAAVRRPERFSRFVLMNTAAFRSTHCPLRIRLCRVPLLGRLAVQGLNLFARAALSMATAKPERLTPPVRAGLLAPYDTWSNRRAVCEFVQDIPLSPSHRSYATLADVEAGLAQFHAAPVCLIWGMQDWCFTPHFLERFIEFFPQAAVHRFEDAGHYVVEDAHERIAPIIRDFVARGEPGDEQASRGRKSPG